MSLKNLAQHKVHPTFSWGVIAVLVLVAVTVVALVVIPQNLEKNEADKAKEEFLQGVAKSRNVVTFGGVIAAVKGDDLTIASPTETIEVKLTQNTMIAKGDGNDKVTKADLKEKLQVQVSYSLDTKELESVWFE